MLSGAAATMLAVVTVIGATHDKDNTLVLIATGWWIAGAIIGATLGRRAQVTAPIGRLLADAKQATMLPEHRPGAVILNRLWPLLASTVAAGAVGFIFPQVPAVACGLAIIWSLAWRRPDSAGPPGGGGGGGAPHLRGPPPRPPPPPLGPPGPPPRGPAPP